VHGLIGKGSFGEVYLVERKEKKTFHAMKVLDKDALKSFFIYFFIFFFLIIKK